MKNGALFDTLRCLLWITVNLIMSEYWTSMTVSEFNLSFKASLRATSLLWISFILELELTSITTISYLDSHFERETKGNSEIVYLLGPFGNTSCNTLSKVNLALCRKPGLYHHPPLRFFFYVRRSQSKSKIFLLHGTPVFLPYQYRLLAIYDDIHP